MRKRNDTGTLGKLMEVLDLIARADEPPRFTDLLAALGQPRGTLHRHLSHLAEEGLVETDRDGLYSVGLRVLELASKSWSKSDVRLICEPHLVELQRQTGETVHLGVLRDTAVIYLDKVEGRQPVRMYSQIGNASPAYCTGVGKAALSVLPAAMFDDVLSRLQFRQFTRTTKDAVSLPDEIDVVRQRGYAFDLEEHEEGICCIAAPVHSPEWTFVGAISITGPAYRLTQAQLEEWAPPLCSAARAIMADMHLRFGPRA